MRGLNLDHLLSFGLVVELGTFSAAADRLELTQPAVSLQIRQLEQRLGVRLIERVGRRATPSAAGSELLLHLQRMEDVLADMTDAMAQHAEGAVGRVRIGTGGTACIYLLPDVLRDLRRRLPGLDITVRIGNSTEVLKGVEENRLDLGFVTLPAPGRMFEVTPVMEDGFVAAVPADSTLPAVLTPEILARQLLVLYEPGGHTRDVIDRWFAEAGVSPKPVMELGSVEAIKEMVGAGLGCAILPEMAFRTAGSLPAGVATRKLAPSVARTLGIVVRRDKTRHRALRETIKALEAFRAPSA